MVQPIVAATRETSLLPLTLHGLSLTDEQFVRLCRDNRELRFELTTHRELIIISPTTSKTGWRNAEILFALMSWAKEEGSGLCFDSSTGFTLPNGAKRSPDASWVRKEYWAALSEAQQEAFAPLCPEFVVELRSKNDSLSVLQAKMEEYLANGTSLGWLIDPEAKQVYRYRPGEPMQRLDEPETVAGEGLLAGFVFRVSEIW